MAVLNEILVGRFNRSLQKLYGVKGIVPVKALAPEVMPVHVIFQGMETRFLDGWGRFGNTFTIPAGATTTGAYRILNPAFSNTIALIESILLSAPAPLSFREDQGPASLGDLSAGNPSITLDTRLNASALCHVSQSSLSPPTSQIYQSGIIAGNTLAQLVQNVNQERTLLPGFFLQWSNININQAFFVSLIWRERFLEEPERLDLPKASVT
jgi:hypothetical protein